MMSRSELAVHSISTVPKLVRPPVTCRGAKGCLRFRITVSWRLGPETPYSLNASPETM
jgi:hypothetical protein